MLTAHGSRDSHAVTLADGRPNGSRSAGTPYPTVTWAGIRSLVESPARVPKEDAQWFVPSSYHDHDGRTHAVQRERGVFHALAVDIDDGDPSLAAVAAAVATVTGGAGALIYSSSSAAPDNRKWRALIPLTTPVAGTDYADTQLALFALLGQQGLTCDETLARAAQPIYLPNVPPHRRGADGQPVFYQRQVIDGVRLELVDDHPIVVQRERMRADRAAAKAAEDARAQSYRARHLAHVAATGDDFQPIQHFNDHHTVAAMLSRYGFVRRDGGRGSHWKSPLSTSGSYSTEDRGDHWVTVSNWAHACNVGRISGSGHRYGSAFDLFCYFDHGGDQRAAVRAYADQVRPRDDDDQVDPALPVAPRPTPAGDARALDDWRAEVADRRAVAVTQPGLHIDRSPTGSGKTHATVTALRGVPSSLTVLPTHTNVVERVDEMRQQGIPAVAFPELTPESCQNYGEASRAQSLGLVAGAVVCPGCPFKSGCPYRAAVAAAEGADHRVGTHARLLRSSRAAKDVRVIVVDESPEAVLAPSLTISVGDITPVTTLAHAIRDYFWSTADPDQRAFASALLDVVSAIHAACRQVESTGAAGTTPVDLHVSHQVPQNWQRLLYRSISQVGVASSLTAEALTLVTKAAAGELDDLHIVTDLTCAGRLVHFVVGSWRLSLPADAAVIALDATADADDLADAVGGPVDDCTPAGHLATTHPVVQLVDDCTRGMSADAAAGVVEAFLRRHPAVRRLGIIGHQPHVRAIVEGDALAANARARVAKSCWFGQGPDRASNDWHRECDHVLVLGTPRPNPGTHRRWLVLHGLHDAAGRDGDWGPRPWSSVTVAGEPCTVAGTGYRDPDWDRAYRATCRAALMQAVGRGRSILPDGVPVTVVTSDPTPFPVAPPLEPAPAAVRATVDVVRSLLASPGGWVKGPIGIPYSGNYPSGAVPTHAVVAALATATATTGKPGGISRGAVKKRLRAAADAGVLVQVRRGWWAPADGHVSQVVTPAPTIQPAAALPPPPTPTIISSGPYPQGPNVPGIASGESVQVPDRALSPGRGIVISTLPPVATPDVVVVIADQPAVTAGGTTATTTTMSSPAPLEPDDLLMLVEERAAILEHDAGHQRDVADRLAREMVMGRDAPTIAPTTAPTPVGVLPSDIADIHARSLPLVQEALHRFGGAARRLPDRPPGAHDPRRPPPRQHGVCACGHSDRWVRVPIHDGRSVRIDCGHCDRFGWWGVWHGVRQPHPDDETQPAAPPVPIVMPPGVDSPLVQPVSCRP